jgi:DNA helicase II / ATP-dependent DNA helicase PcrA
MSQSPLCPKCNSSMIKRHRKSDGNAFWGCSTFPRCRGLVPGSWKASDDEPKVEKVVNWSEYQTAVFDLIENGEGHAVVEAVAGSGKTTTILEGLKYTPKHVAVAFVAFDRRIALELQSRSPSHVHVSTLHSLGLKNIRDHFGKVKVENRKQWLIFNLITKGQQSEHISNEIMDEYQANVSFTRAERETLQENAVLVNNLVSMCKATLLDPTPENLDWIYDRYGHNTNGDTELIFRAVAIAFRISVRLIETVIDFDDMIYAPAVGIVKCEKFDFLFVDEAQDLNKSQIEFVLNSITETGRIIAVGDRAQSIYGFRGADTEAIPNLITALDAVSLPLSICYRCPPNHIEMAQGLVPTIQPFDGKDDGVIEHISFGDMLESVKPGDLIMCRTNAPLVAPAFELIRRGIKAVVLGRDIGKGLAVLVKKVQKRNTSNNLLELLHDMSEYRDMEVAKLMASKKGYRAARLDDQIETIIALASNCNTIPALITRIDQVFDDRVQGVVFSSVHKAKGTEAERVFILRPDLMPHPMAGADWEKAQEVNVEYVALTRSKSELYFVSGT